MTPRILIVEDEPIAREALSELLRDEGYQVATAAGGHEALASVTDEAPDLVLSDVRMPAGDGLELVKNLRARPTTAAIPVLLLSACADGEKITGLDLGADDVICKPIDLPELLARMRGHLRRLEERRELERRALTDPVTGLPNRRAIGLALHREVDHARHDGLPLSVLLLDIDGFRALNREHGHQVGDTVLRHVARALREAVHDDDHLGRWGGDELLVVLPRCDEAVAAAVASRVEHRKLPLVAVDDAGSVIVRATVGLATLRPHETAGALLARAEQDLDRKRGRASRTTAPPPPS